jgi:hypothetical protein
VNLVKTFLTWVIILGFLGFAGWQTYQFMTRSSQPHTTVTLQGDTYQADIAATAAVREKGLSGTDPLDKNQGMLFAFTKDDTWGIWMKDMKYPIDILWLNSNKEVTYIVKNADPSSYPYTTFKPQSPARYVFEIPAGTVEARGYKIGTKATFDLPDDLEVTE